MKTKAILLCLMGLLFALSCKNDDEPDFPPEITTVINSVSASLDSLSNALATDVAYFATSGVDTSVVRTRLQNLYNASSFATEFVFTTPQGILQLVEPPAFYPSQGTDISQQAHIIKAFQTKKPVLSDAFQVVEGYQAVVEIHPVVNNNQVLGALSGLYVPSYLLERSILPVIMLSSKPPFEIWVMEKSGKVLYDQDAAEIGLNVFTDSAYANFPELIAACQKIANQASGETSYSYFQTGTTTVVTKKTYWKTLGIHGNEWKIIWVRAQ